MRTRDHERIRAECRAALPSVLEPLGRVASSVRADDEGWVNVLFYVNDDLVIRFNTRDPELPKVAREAEALRLMRAHGLPVPEVLLADASRIVAPYDVLVLSRVAGGSLERRRKELDADRADRLTREAGALYARVWEIRPDGFGELAVPAVERHFTFAAYFDELRELRLREALETGAIDDGHACRVRAAFATAADAISAVTSPCLVHGDAHLGNVLTDDERITALLDLEWSRSGDWLEDIVILPEIAHFAPGAEVPFREGLLGGRELTPDERCRLTLHRCLRNLEMCVVAFRHVSDDLEDDVRITREHIARLPEA